MNIDATAILLFFGLLIVADSLKKIEKAIVNAKEQSNGNGR